MGLAAFSPRSLIGRVPLFDREDEGEVLPCGLVRERDDDVSRSERLRTWIEDRPILLTARGELNELRRHGGEGPGTRVLNIEDHGVP